MNQEWQQKAPIYEALVQYKANRVVPFDVPGHKQGRGNKELRDFLGKDCLSVDVNSMKPLDNLCHPVSVIREAEAIAADAFGAKQAFFMVNGTTSAVQSMVLSVCKRGEKIIMPRNVHRSAINALVIRNWAFRWAWDWKMFVMRFWSILTQKPFWSTTQPTTVFAPT